jgi:hypothetical protein
MFADSQYRDCRDFSLSPLRNRQARGNGSPNRAKNTVPVVAAPRSSFLLVVLSFCVALLLTFWCLGGSEQVLDSHSQQRSASHRSPELLPPADQHRAASAVIIAAHR